MAIPENSPRIERPSKSVLVGFIGFALAFELVAFVLLGWAV